MLVNIQIQHPDHAFSMITALISRERGAGPVRLSTGFYQSGHWSFDMILGDQLLEEWPEFSAWDSDDYLNCYGVCDSPIQLLAKLPDVVTEGPRCFVVNLVQLDKELEPEEGGWRWHKWGTYIGEQEPRFEYLAQEPEIETVFTYHIYEVRS